MRLTRAARRAEEAPLEADASISREPLAETTANTADSPELETDELKNMAPARTKSKRGKKGANSTKTKPEEEVQVVLEDERHAAGSPASDAAAEDLAGEPTDDIGQIPMRDRRPSEPPGPSRAVRLTRRQLALQEEELAKSQRLDAPPAPPEPALEGTDEIAPHREQLDNNEATPAIQSQDLESAPPVVVREAAIVEAEAVEPHEQGKNEGAPAIQAQSNESAPADIAGETIIEEAEELTDHEHQDDDAVLTAQNQNSEPAPADVVPPAGDGSAGKDSLGSAEIAAIDLPTEEPTIPELLTDIPLRGGGEELSQEPEPSATPASRPDVTIAAAQDADSMMVGSTTASEAETNTPEAERAFPAEPQSLVVEKPSELEQENSTPDIAPKGSPSSSPATSIEESNGPTDAPEEVLEEVDSKPEPATTDMGHPPRKANPTAATPPKPDAAASKPAPSSQSSKDPASPTLMKASSRPSVGTSGRPRPSIAPAHQPSHARSSSVRAASAKGPRKAPGEVTDYLASKRRPISISFPAPPPPPKASKPPTRSNFQLPGEAVAARLKAAKEERLKREQEGGRRASSATFRAPVVKSAKPPTRPSFQLPGEAVAAKLKALKEERLAREAQGGSERPASATFRAPPPPKSSKPPTVPNFQLPGEAVAAKLKAQREERLKREQEEAAKKPVSKARPAPVHKAAPVVKQIAASKARESILTGGDKKETKAEKPTHARRVSSAPSNPTSNKRASTMQTKPATGREVFNRDKVAKEQQLKERREKEEAAKKARAEAAERSRLASREWAEKQKRKAMAAKARGQAGANIGAKSEGVAETKAAAQVDEPTLEVQPEADGQTMETKPKADAAAGGP